MDPNAASNHDADTTASDPTSSGTDASLDASATRSPEASETALDAVSAQAAEATSDASTPVAPTADGGTADGGTPDPAPDAVPDTVTDTDTVPDVTVTEATVPEATVPEATAPEATSPEASAPEATAPDTVTPAALADPETGTAPAAEATDERDDAPASAAAGSPDGEVAAPAPPTATAAMIAAGLQSGQIVEGRVVAVDAAEAVVELGDGSVGVIAKRHLTANGRLDPSELLAVGDGVEAAVLVRDDPKGRLVLSRAWALKQRAWEAVEAAKAANAPITGRVTGQVKGGLVVDVGTRAFLPASQVDLHHVDDLASFVGTDIEALIQEMDRANDKIVLSRRNLLRAAERAKSNEFAATLAPGQIHRGRVVLLTDFGAFVEVGGIRGLVHLSELAWGRVERAAEVVSPGDEVDVKVLAMKPGKKLSLSIRALTPDPLGTLQNGQILTGTVTRLADFGAFVRVGDGAEGLVHVTELAEYRVHAPEEIVAPGDEVLVKVIRIDRKRRRLDLSVNQALLS